MYAIGSRYLKQEGIRAGSSLGTAVEWRLSRHRQVEKRQIRHLWRVALGFGPRMIRVGTSPGVKLPELLDLSPCHRNLSWAVSFSGRHLFRRIIREPPLDCC